MLNFCFFLFKVLLCLFVCFWVVLFHFVPYLKAIRDYFVFVSIFVVFGPIQR